MRQVVTKRLVALVTLIFGLALLWRWTQINPSPRTQVTPSPQTQVTPSPQTQVTPSPRTQVTPSRRTQVTPSRRTQVTPSRRTQVTPSRRTQVTPSQSPPTIPRIIHQTWKGATIPTEFTPWVRSWMQMNPSWQYWLWTAADSRCFMKHHFPQHLRLYDSYTYDINRADMTRYFVLYTHGGLYADLDMECVRPLDKVVLRHPCVVTEENHAHSYVVQRRAAPANIINCLMGCRPRHPFFRKLIRALGRNKKTGSDDDGKVLDQTGPFFMDKVLRRYLKASSQRPSQDVVTVLPPVYFSSRFDNMQLTLLKRTCLNTSVLQLHADARHTCRHLVDSKFANVLDPESIADHHWQHTYWDMDKFMTRPQESVADIARLVAHHFNTTHSTPPAPIHSTPHTNSTPPTPTNSMPPTPIHSTPHTNSMPPTHHHTCYTPTLKFGPFK